MLVTQGEVKQGQPESNSSELTRGSSPAGPETAEGLGIPPTATKWPAEGIYATGRLVRVEWCTQQRLQWPKSTAAATCAAAGVRASVRTTLRCTGEGAGACVRLLRAWLAGGCYWGERRSSGARGSLAMAMAGARFRGGGG